MGIYDNSLFDAPSQTGYDTFQQLLKDQRAQLEQTRPDIAQQMPVLGAATPGQQQFQAQKQQGADQLATGVSQLTNMLTQQMVPPGAEKKDIKAIQEQNQGLINMALDQVNPLKPKELWGPDVGKHLGMPQNSGGILGLGITPIDILLHAVGAGLTSRLPQEQAMNMTMKIGGLARDFRATQEKAATDFINQIQQGMQIQNTTTHMGILQQQQQKEAEKQQAIEIAGALADEKKAVPIATLIKAGVPAQLALGIATGHFQIVEHEGGMAAVNTSNPSDIRDLGLKKGPKGSGTTPYADIQRNAIANNLVPGTNEYQDYVDKRQAAQQGGKALAGGQAMQPLIIERIDRAAQKANERIDYRLRAYGNAPVTEKTASLWVDGDGGRIIDTRDLLGKSPTEVLDKYPQAVRLASAAERGQLASATSLVHLSEMIDPLLKKLLPKYGNTLLSDIASVQGNKLAIKLKATGGDPDIAKAESLLNDFLIEAPLAMGMVAGREGPELLKMVKRGLPGLGGTIQSSMAGKQAMIDSVATRWLARGIDIKGGKGGAVGAAPQGGVPELTPAGNQFMQELQKALQKMEKK